jgi:error-prone DNA polymerase
MVAAGFSAGEADQLRRSMAAWKRRGGLEKFEPQLMRGMRKRGYPKEFARQIFKQIKGFGEYGFPESHSASFALLAYVSAWLKRYHPAAFTGALLNSQPMGFYTPAQLIQDARRHGVEVRPVDIRYSDKDCALEYSLSEKPRLYPSSPAPQPALRLGLRTVKGLSQAGIETLLAARRERPFRDVQDLVTRSTLDRKDLGSLAAADALKGLAGHRHRAWWQVSGTEKPLPLFGTPHFQEAEPLLRKPREGEAITADYASMGFTLGRHPLALLRDRLKAYGIHSASELWALRNGTIAKAAGLVLTRQRPSSASGVIFTTLEDETGTVNVVVWPSFAEAQRQALLKAQLLAVTGTLQQESGVPHLIAGRLEDLTAWLGELDARSRDFH